MKTDCLPYRSISDGLKLEVTEVKFGDADIDARDFSVQGGGWNLCDCQSAWTEMTATLTVRLNDESHEDLGALLVSGESWEEDTNIGVRVIDHTARLRDKVMLAKHDDEWRGQLHLERGDCQGTVELSAFAVRKNTKQGSFDGLAMRRGEMLCLSDMRSIWITKKPPIVGASIDNEWVNFSDVYPDRRDALFLVNLDDESSPRLCLNEGVEGLKPLLKQEGTAGVSSRIRDLAMNAILVPALLELLIAAVQAGDPIDVDHSPEFPYAWQSKIVSHLASHCPGSSAERVQHKWVIAGAEDDLGAFIGEMNYAIQKHVSLSTSVTKLVGRLNLKGADDE